MREKNRRNYYRLLHVQPDAPAELIKASYRTLMRTLKQHPDLGGDGWNAALINEAYAVLSDPASRQRYDREQRDVESRGATSRASTGSEAAPPPAPEPPRSTGPSTGRPTGSHLCVFCRAMTGGTGPDPDECCAECGAPLRLLDITVSGETRRAVPRIDHHTEMTYLLEPASPRRATGYVVDLSPTGLRFSGPERLTVGCLIKIESPTLSAVASVTRSDAEAPDRYATGVRFVTLRLNKHRGTFVSARA